MTNPYYNGGAFPATGAPATSASMRAELASISTGFDKLPTLSGNATKLVAVNSSGTALEAVTVLPSLTITDTNLVIEDNADSTRKFRFEASSVSAGATRVLTVPDANMTIAGLDVAQTLTNKTISGSSNTLSNIGNASLTNSSLTVGSTSISLGATATTLAGLTSVTSTSFVGTLTGNADTVTNGVYTTGSYANPAWITSLAETKVLPSQTGNAGKFLTTNGTSSSWGPIIVQTATPWLTAVGGNAATSTTGIRNTAIGFETLKLNTTGANNTAVGFRALENNTASSNVAVGAQAGTGVTTGGQNIYIGVTAGTANASGANNVGIGSSALLTTTGSSNNAAVGYYALAAVTSGANNTALGYQAGYSGTNNLTTGSNNIIIGYNAEASAAGVSNEITIGNSSNTSLRLPGLGISTTAASLTANGVTYLNGSKVLTSGSALTFDGTNLTQTAGTPVFTVFETASGNNNRLILTQNSGLTTYNLTYSSATTNAHVFQIGGGEQMRLTSTGLGIGTSSPGQKLEVAGNVLMNTTNPALLFNTSAYQVYKQGTTLRLYANSLDHLTCDGSGNVGIGTSSPATKLEVTGDITQTWAAAMDRFVGSKFSTTYELGIHFIESTRETRLVSKAADSTGLISFYTGVTPTERMRLDSSGNLGLGGTPSAWSGYNAFQIGDAGSTPLAYIASDAASNTVTNIGHGAYWNGSNWLYTSTSVGATRYQMTGANAGSTHAWFVSAGGTAGNAISFTQAMTLHASGGLSVGNTSDPGAGSVNTGVGAANSNNYVIRLSAGTSGLSRFIAADTSDAGYIDYEHSSDAWIFRTGGTERARITSGGDLLVGTTSAATFTPKLAVVAPGSQYGIEVQSNTVGYYAGLFTNTATSGDNYFLYFGTEANGSTQRGSITYNRAGGLVAYNTTSDYRAKDILGPVASPGATIDALKVYEGQMKGATQSRPMLVAHEAQAVAPYSVTGEKDAVNDDGTPKFQQIDVSSLVPLLIAEIQSLRARVAALEA